MAFETPGWARVLDLMQALNASWLSLPVFAQAMATERKSVAGGGPFCGPEGVRGDEGFAGWARTEGATGVVGGPKICANEFALTKASKMPDSILFIFNPF